MSLAVLPWFIKNEIILMVIQDSTEYGLISKEWLEQTARVHGEILLNIRRPKEILRRSFSPHVEKIWLGRVDDIDWEVLHSYENIRKILFNIQVEYSTIQLEEFNNKLIQFPNIESVRISVHNQVGFDITHFMVWNQQRLKELDTSIGQISEFLRKKETVFSSLVSLELDKLTQELGLQSIANTMPQLRMLTIRSSGTIRKFSFIDIQLPKLKQLILGSSAIEYATLELNLNSLPCLKSIDTLFRIEFKASSNFDQIEELAIGGYLDYITRILNHGFNKLNKLALSLYESPDSDTLYNIFNSSKTLTTLELSLWEEFVFPANLPVTPYTITKLHLRGLFIINSGLLHWLSDNFKLKELEFKYCELEEDIATLDTVSFGNLRKLQIYSRDKVSEFKSHFNRTTYPHVKTISVSRVCESCSQVLESDHKE